jgi:hypothetical protein
MIGSEPTGVKISVIRIGTKMPLVVLGINSCVIFGTSLFTAVIKMCHNDLYRLCTYSVKNSLGIVGLRKFCCE